MTLRTRLTEQFGIEHPIVPAPMAPASGGDLASAVAEAGGLGMLGIGYADREWFEKESAKVTHPNVGSGFIAWTLAEVPGILEEALARRPRAMMLSFTDPKPYARTVKDAGVPLFCQVHTIEHAKRAIEVGADVVVAQGTEAGGHGLNARSTMSFVPGVVDLVAKRAPDVLVLAAGGIADGRGLAAALMLGADGALMGTRFWATAEALIPEEAKRKILPTTGDETVRTSVYDIVKQKNWPGGLTGRNLRNTFTDKWHGREAELRAMRSEEVRKVTEAWDEGDFETANVTVGEAIGLINDLPRAGDVVRRTARQAVYAIGTFARVT